MEPDYYILYLGPGQFAIDAADEPLTPGDVIDSTHRYWVHRSILKKRIDFKCVPVEAPNELPEVTDDG